MNIKQKIKQILLLSFVVFGNWAYAIRPYSETTETIDSISRFIDLESVSIQAVRANERTPVSFSTMDKTEIQRLNNVTNIPVLLQLMPSVVATTENGTAMGNTSFRIRGVDASRINVTINGLPLNNPASQEVFWVNLPNLSGFLNSVQVQRGVGTSTNGSAAFGASVNLETEKISPQPNLDVSTTVGSFNTLSTNVSAGSGLLKNGMFAEGSYSKINSDGYIRNGKIDYQSAYFSTGLVKSKPFLKVNYWYGDQKTGITWRGATKEQLERDRRFNEDGLIFANSPIRYDNETDNYRSHIFQAFYAYTISDHWIFNTGFNYTNGFGYYETFRANRRFSDFGFNPQTVDGTTYSRSDVIRQQFMSNDFYVANINFMYAKNSLNMTIGGNYSYYDGDHYGRLKWVQRNENISPKDNWYENVMKKTEASFFTKFEYTFFEKFNAFLDLQYRYVNQELSGVDSDLLQLDFSKDYSFFNPKIGLSFQIDAHQKLYAFVAKSSREPRRSDVKENANVKPEHLTNYELGYQINKNRLAFGSNIYFMDYKDQFVPNGRLSESGYALMDNVAKSYRLGVELVGGYQICKPLRIDANLTLSQNKILDYLVLDALHDPNTWLPVRPVQYKERTLKSSDLAFSPNVVGSGILTYSPIQNLNIMLTGKYVGKQFFDNFSTPENQLDIYFVCDLNVRYEYPLKGKDGRKIYVQGVINNLFNKDYISNANTYTTYFIDGTSFTESRFFVQAPIHFSIKLGVKL
ncbi:MAG: TonB-dependent receptor [Bacteroidales bacterium]|jgi:iron complex outermembrane receptor protein|nr:TonB-dependent receptor [Bacteroidales bacterium]